jgi:regulator of sigma D
MNSSQNKKTIVDIFDPDLLNYFDSQFSNDADKELWLELQKELKEKREKLANEVLKSLTKREGKRRAVHHPL